MDKSVKGKLQKGNLVLQDMKTHKNFLKAEFKIYLLTLCSSLEMCNKTNQMKFSENCIMFVTPPMEHVKLNSKAFKKIRT